MEVKQEECRGHRDDIYRRLNDASVRFTEIETKLDAIIAISKVLGGGVLTGIISIIVIMLTR